MYRHTDTDKHMHRHTDTHMYRHIDTDKHMHRHTQTHRQTHAQTSLSNAYVSADIRLREIHVIKSSTVNVR